MAKMKAAMAAVLVMEKEGVTQAFGVPGAAINPFYAQMRERQSIAHVLARHVEGATHMAEGYTRAAAGNIGVCLAVFPCIMDNRTIRLCSHPMIWVNIK